MSKHCTFCHPVCVRNPNGILFLVFTYSALNFSGLQETGAESSGTDEFLLGNRS